MTSVLTEIPCPYCEASASKPWAEENGYTAVQCLECDFVYVSPRLPDYKISEAAQTGLHDTEKGQMTVVARFHKNKVGMFRKRLEALFPQGEIKGRAVSWLDVGAGYGELLLALREMTAINSVLEGIEPCVPKILKARSMGCNISNRNLSDIVTSQ